MIYADDNPKSHSIIIPCDCHTEKLVISKFDDDCNLYFLSFYINSFYAGQSIIYILIDRIKLAWRALTKGNFVFQEMSMDKRKLLELRDNINEIILEESCSAVEKSSG